MAKKPADPDSEMSAGQYRELASHMLKQLPTRVERKLRQYMIDHPLFTRAALELLFEELEVPFIKSCWSGALHIKDDFDANDALQKLGAVQGRKSGLEMLERELAKRPTCEPSHPYEYWSIKPVHTRLLTIETRARRQRPATPFELVAYIARGWRPHDGCKSLVSLSAFTVDHQPQVLMYSMNADHQICWTIESAQRLWPMTTSFLVLGQEG